MSLTAGDLSKYRIRQISCHYIIYVEKYMKYKAMQHLLIGLMCIAFYCLS